MRAYLDAFISGHPRRLTPSRARSWQYSGMAPTIEIRRGSLADLPALEPIWVSAHDRHAESMPELFAPYLNDGQTWAHRRALYAELLAKPDTVLQVACEASSLVGYGLAHVVPVGDTWIADTWRTGPRIGEIESLAVLPSHRRRGIGSTLLDALAAGLAAIGVHDLVLGVLPGNADGLGMYERRGFRPTGAYLSKLPGREAD
jgi:ribosomal protein S18 acetylase RimI-like enzyme